MSDAILQTRLRDRPWDAPHTARLPGIVPVPLGDWLRVDEAFGAQMARRAALIAQRGGEVMACLPGAEPAAHELFETVRRALPGLGFDDHGDSVTRPDGHVVQVTGAPLACLARLVQEDFCLLEKQGDEHVLRAALLTFPASWTLHEKLGRPLSLIHGPVAAYDAGIATRVQRLFDAARPDRVLCRVNALLYRDPELFQPRREADPRGEEDRGRFAYLRSERQCLRRLPDSGAVVFSIHTSVLRLSALDPEDRARLRSFVGA